MFYIDGHCDTLSKTLNEGNGLLENNLQFFNRANKIGGGVQVMAGFIDTGFLMYENAGFTRCNNIINKLREYEKNWCNMLIKNKIICQA